MYATFTFGSWHFFIKFLKYDRVITDIEISDDSFRIAVQYL